MVKYLLEVIYFMEKTVLVTGSSSGLGKSIIEKFASNGWNTIITYFTHEKEAIEFNNYIINTYKVDSKCFKLDVTSEKSINELNNKVTNLDVLINNAGISIDNDINLKSKDEFMKVVSVNLLGTFLMSKVFGKNMFERKSGSVINISSNNGIDSYYKESIDYDASKAGVINMGHNLANIYSPYVRVNTVCPGWIDTPMNESINPSFKEKEINKILLKRFARPMEVANLVYFLASEDASYINDSVIKIDGGKVC